MNISENEISIKGLSDLEDVALWILEKVKQQQANVVALYGEMGSGKTTLIAQIAHLKKVTQTPSSPTFALINDYSNADGEVIHHFDFYRIKTLEEAYDLGYQDYFYSGNLCLVEWPELVEELLPENTLSVQIIATSENSRTYKVR